MANLTTKPSSPRPVARSGSPRTRVMVVRQPMRSVRPTDAPDRLPVRLAIGVIVAIGTLMLVWMMGDLGFRLGFAGAMRGLELSGGLAGGIVTGTTLIISIPKVILEAGLAEPMWLMLGFVLIAIPGAGLSAARPGTRGGPQPTLLARTFAITGAVVSVICAGLLVWWIASGLRDTLMDELPLRLNDGAGVRWLEQLQLVAGLDVLAMISAALWVVLVLRLPIPVWIRSIAASAAFFALVVTVVGMSISNGTISQVNTRRAQIYFRGTAESPYLILGYTDQHVATLRIVNGSAIVELIDQPNVLTLRERRSIAELITGIDAVEQGLVSDRWELLDFESASIGTGEMRVRSIPPGESVPFTCYPHIDEDGNRHPTNLVGSWSYTGAELPWLEDGQGTIVGSRVGDDIWLDLNPGTCDRNVIIKARLDGDELVGEWLTTTAAGTAPEGVFSASRGIIE